MADLLRAVLRGATCPEEHPVGGAAGTGTLLCDLQPGHPGPAHYDHTDRIWWSADA